MKKPACMEALLSFIFGWLGIAFLIFAALSWAELLRPKAGSAIQNGQILGICFAALAGAFGAAAFVLGKIAAGKKALHSELLCTGTPLCGTVERVYRQAYTQFGRESPYRIFYSYTLHGKQYRDKSCFLWEKPDIKAGDSIVVYANASGKSTVFMEAAG